MNLPSILNEFFVPICFHLFFTTRTYCNIHQNLSFIRHIKLPHLSCATLPFEHKRLIFIPLCSHLSSYHSPSVIDRFSLLLPVRLNKRLVFGEYFEMVTHGFGVEDTHTHRLFLSESAIYNKGSFKLTWVQREPPTHESDTNTNPFTLQKLLFYRLKPAVSRCKTSPSTKHL